MVLFVVSSLHPRRQALDFVFFQVSLARRRTQVRPKDRYTLIPQRCGIHSTALWNRVATRAISCVPRASFPFLPRMPLFSQRRLTEHMMGQADSSSTFRLVLLLVLLLVASRTSHAWVSSCPDKCFLGRQQQRGLATDDGSSSSSRALRLSLSSLNELLPPQEEDILQKEKNVLEHLPNGIPDSFRVVQQYPTPSLQFTWDDDALLNADDVQRLDLSPHNVTLPVALMLLDKVEYPSFSRARKACRKGNILIHRGPLLGDDFDATRCVKGRVGDRVFPGDVIGKQVRMGSGYFPVLGYKKPPFELPVVYQDDHVALVNKPAGVVVYSQKQGGHGVMTVRAALPFVLEPPQRGTYAVMRRPASVHRLDKPTSGILCIAKTKPAMLHLSRQFHDRIIRKTYFAIINGIPPETPETALTPQQAHDLGVDVDPNDKRGGWHLIDAPLDGKHAITVWRAVRYAKSLRAHDNYLTLVELKPKTGRYHQLRRHMAWQAKCPLVGDSEYDEGTASAMSFRDKGLFLCSTRVVLEHPYFNTSPETIHEWNPSTADKFDECNIAMSENGRLVMTAQVALPNKFENLLQHEEERYNKFGSQANPTYEDESDNKSSLSNGTP